MYQADWLIRLYGFNVNEIVGFDQPNLDLDIDPKLGWALRNMHQFPVDVNTADLELIKRIPGIGFLSARKIVAARKFKKLVPQDLHQPETDSYFAMPSLILGRCQDQDWVDRNLQFHLH